MSVNFGTIGDVSISPIGQRRVDSSELFGVNFQHRSFQMKKSLISQVMAELGRRKSAAKSASSKRNGAKGGRPRKKRKS